jgi:hypothetical protein
MKVTAALSSLPPLMELIGGAASRWRWYGSIRVSAADDARRLFSFMFGLLMMCGPAKKPPREREPAARRRPELDLRMLDTHTEVVEQPDARAMAFRRTIEFADVSPATRWPRQHPPRRVVCVESRPG